MVAKKMFRMKCPTNTITVLMLLSNNFCCFGKVKIYKKSAFHAKNKYVYACVLNEFVFEGGKH